MPRLLADLLICLRFFSRLPLPVTEREIALGPRGLAAATATVPLAGALIGCCPALVLTASAGVGLSAPVSALMALAILLLVTGALHEDGLADCVDGFGGGATRERKLEIMRDSRIGTYGACAVALSLAIRAASLATLVGHGIASAAVALVTSAAVSRTLCLLPLALLVPARSSGLGASAGGPDRAAFGIAIALSAALACVPLLCGTSISHALASYAAAWATALGFVLVARRQIGGHTGDVAGATQQLGEIVMLAALSAGL